MNKDNEMNPHRSLRSTAVVLRKGFTIIELLIVLAIIGILATIAFPTYQTYVIETRRSDGQNLLMRTAAAQERFFTLYSSYTNVVIGPAGCAGTACGLGFSSAESDGDFYTLNVDVRPAGCAPGGTRCTEYTLTVAPQGLQVEDADCGDLTLANRGNRGASGPKGAACWN